MHAMYSDFGSGISSLCFLFDSQACFSRMSKRPSSDRSSSSRLSAPDPLQDSQTVSRGPLSKQARQDLRAELVAVSGLSGGTKASVARVLQKLQKEGMLVDPLLGGDDEDRYLTTASRQHASAPTPYGPVVQHIALESNDEGKTIRWDIIHPFAYVWYLSCKCSQFGDFVGNCSCWWHPLIASLWGRACARQPPAERFGSKGACILLCIPGMARLGPAV